MLLPLPELRDRMGWAWIFREVHKVRTVYDMNPSTIELPLDVFRTIAERVNPCFVDAHFLELHKIMVSGLIVRGKEQLQNQMDIKETQPDPFEGGD